MEEETDGGGGGGALERSGDRRREKVDEGGRRKMVCRRNNWRNKLLSIALNPHCDVAHRFCCAVVQRSEDISEAREEKNKLEKKSTERNSHTSCKSKHTQTDT